MPPIRAAKQKTWSVTVECFGRVSTRRFRATSRDTAERKALAEAGLKVSSQEIKP